ncbi:MAG TPA: hypothetical protein GX519_01310 [Thermoanaerobacterales bacterium]|nr:hypothetical protein [Thermoanaerobacterales bacterium]
MTRDELVMALNEIEAQRNILLSALDELEKPETDPTDFESEEEPVGPKKEPDLINFDIKDIMYNAITSGSFKNALMRISDGMDFTKTALKSFSAIIDKTRDKLEGNIDEVPGPMGMPIMTDMWLQMLLTLLQTQEFQHLLANMFAQFFKDGENRVTV